MAGVLGVESCWTIEDEASIQLALFDLTMYLPPLPAGGLENLGEKDMDVGGGERVMCE